MRIASSLLNTVYDYYSAGELRFQPLHIGGAKDLILHVKVAKEHQHDERRRR